MKIASSPVSPIAASDDEVFAAWMTIAHQGEPWQSVSAQRCGCARDYIVDCACTKPYGRRAIELKRDKESLATGNVFIEFEQTFDDKRTWQPSGLMLALAQAHDFVVLATSGKKSWFFWGTPQYWLGRAERYRYRETKPEANGNRKGCYARGWLVPIRRELFDEWE